MNQPTSHFAPASPPIFVGRQLSVATALERPVRLFLSRRRMGKTSLCWEAGRQLAKRGELVVEIDPGPLRVRLRAGIGDESFRYFDSTNEIIAWVLGHIPPKGGRDVALLVDEPSAGTPDEFLIWLVHEADAAAAGLGRFVRVILFDHVEVLDRMMRIRRTGSVHENLVRHNAERLGPLSRAETLDALHARGLMDMDVAAWWWSGGHPLRIAEIAHFMPRSAELRRPINEITRACGPDGEGTDDALRAWLWKHWRADQIPEVLTAAQRRELGRVLAAHLLRANWPMDDSQEMDQFIGGFYVGGDDQQLRDTPHALELLAELAAGPLPRNMPFSGDRGHALSRLVDFGYLNAGGGPDDEDRPIHGVDVITLARAVHLPENLGRLQPTVETPAASPSPEARPSVIKAAHLQLAEGRLDLDVGSGRSRRAALGRGSALVVAMLGVHKSMHIEALEAAFRCWVRRYDIKADQSITDFCSQLRGVLKSSLGDELAAGAAEAYLGDLVPRSRDRHHALRLPSLNVLFTPAEQASLLAWRLAGPLCEPTAATPAELAGAWQRFVRSPLLLADSRESVPTLCAKTKQIVIVAMGRSAYLACPSDVEDRAWSPGSIDVVDGKVVDPHPPGRTWWSPEVPVVDADPVKSTLIGSWQDWREGIRIRCVGR